VENVLVVVGSGVLLVVAVLLGVVLSMRWTALKAPSLEERVGTLEGRLDRLESKHKLLGAEWNDTHSKLDTLVRRGVRLGVLERKEGELPPPSSAEPLTRSELIKRHREGKKE